MKPLGRRSAALAGLIGAIALLSGAQSARADSLRADIELTTKDIGSKESAVGNLVADSIRSAVKCDAAFIAADYFTEVTIPKGAITNADILRALVMPGDSISIVKLTGDQIQRGMERSLLLYPKFNSGFLEVSGMVVTFRPDADADKRVISIKINGDAIEPNKNYLVAMPTPLAKGGLAYFKIWKASDISKETDKTLQTAVNGYLADHKTIYKGEERLVAKGK
ncbi:MAG TPA: 5'-nucleotidase [Chthonomonadaceae bacterium]|nr:5'-nucleotidase [Chthonomonadaceae bacterium]